MAPSGDQGFDLAARISDLALGSKDSFLVDVVPRPTGTPLQLPFEIVKGAEQGPTIAIVSGVHGNEPMGPLGLRHFLTALDPGSLSGTVLAMPIANPVAFEQRRRTGIWDDIDLVRIWPGDSTGTATHRTASIVFDAISQNCQYFVDLHGGTQILHESWVIYANRHSPATDTAPDVEETSQQMAIAFGTDQIIRAHPWKTTVSAAATAGIPIILAEIGGGPDAHSASGHFLKTMKNGLENVLKHLGMLSGDPVFDSPATREYDVLEEFLATDSRGLWDRRAQAGDDLVAGAILGGFVDPLTGEDLHTVIATKPGTVLNAMVTWPQVDPGQWLMATGHLVATHERSIG